MERSKVKAHGMLVPAELCARTNVTAALQQEGKGPCSDALCGPGPCFTAAAGPGNVLDLFLKTVCVCSSARQNRCSRLETGRKLPAACKCAFGTRISAHTQQLLETLQQSDPARAMKAIA